MAQPATHADPPSMESPNSQSPLRTSESPASETSKKKSRQPPSQGAGKKRRCVSTACVACRRRKSKCNGAMPSCAACSSVYGTECVYDPYSDHRRRKGVFGTYREEMNSMKTRNATLQILIGAILNSAEDEVPEIVRQIRTCESLDAVAESLQNRKTEDKDKDESPMVFDDASNPAVEGERELAQRMGELRLENGSVRFIGGTSHLIYLPPDATEHDLEPAIDSTDVNTEPLTSWTLVTDDTQLVIHLVNMYFNWHYRYFAVMSKRMFYQDFLRGRRSSSIYCSSLLVNAILAVACHFTDVPGAYAVPGDSRTKGDHFFAEAKRLIVENDEYEKPRLTTVQALAIMSVREAGCGRESKGWVYSGMSFRMAHDIGLSFDAGSSPIDGEQLSEQEVDARRITFWACFLFDKCWSNYLGRLPQIPKNWYNVPKFDVFPDEEAEVWSPFTDDGFDQSSQQPARTRAIGLQLSKLCEISSDILLDFYHPTHISQSSRKAVELKKLSELHGRLDQWHKDLPVEFEPKDGLLPNAILMHMFFHLQYIHLFRPFLKYSPAASPLPSHVSPRRICTANAAAISKLSRLYKKCWNMRQICNIAVYMIHSACTIHLLNLPDKVAQRDITHGVKHLEEIANDWLCARRTLSILSVLSRKWNCDLPDEAATVLRRTDEKYGTFMTLDVPSPPKPLQKSLSPPVSLSGPPSNYLSEFPLPLEADGHRLMAPAPQPQPLRQQPLTGQGMTNLVPTSTCPPDTISLLQDSSSLADFTLPLTSYQTFTPLPPAQPILPQTQTQLSQNSPIYESARIDGREWYLKDGVRWQQNFESWDLNPPLSAQTQPTTSAPQSNPLAMSDPMSDQMFLLPTGSSPAQVANMNGSDEFTDPFEGFSVPMGNTGWLTRLD